MQRQSRRKQRKAKDVRVSQRTETDSKLHKQQRLQCLGGGFANVFQARCKPQAQYCIAEQQSEYTQGQDTILPWAEQ